MGKEKSNLVDAIENAISQQDDEVHYIICDDMLDFEKHEDELKGKDYIIQPFGEYYVAFIFSKR